MVPPKTKKLKLSREAKRISKTKKISGHRPINQWLPLLKELKHCELGTTRRFPLYSGADPLFTFLKLLGRFCLVLPAAAYVYFMLTVIASEDVFWMTWVIGGLFIVIFVILVVVNFVKTINLWAKAYFYKKYFIINDLNYTLNPILKDLSPDIFPEADVELNLNLGLPNQRKNIISKKGAETVYKSHWCSATSPLAVGATLKLDIVNWVVLIKKRSTNPRGKRKLKCKWKAQKQVSVKFVLDQHMILDLNKAKKLAQTSKVKFSNKEKKSFVSMAHKIKFKGRANSPCIKPDIVFGTFVSLCDTLLEKISDPEFEHKNICL